MSSSPPPADGARPRMAEFEKVLTGAAKDVAKFEAPQPFGKKLQNTLHAYPTIIPAVVLVFSILAFGFLAPNGNRFMTMNNLTLVIQQVGVVGLLAIAQTLIILTAGIDLSVGAMMVLCSVIMGKLGVEWGLPGGVAMLIGVAFGGLFGALNGLLITRFKLPPFIVTLGTWKIFFALNLYLSASQTIRSQTLDEQAPFLKWLANSLPLGGEAQITFGALLWLIMTLAFLYVLRLTPFGRYLYAVGDDPDAAELAGVRSQKILMTTYVLAGLICGIAAWALIGRTGSVSPQAGATAALESITAVVIGGTSLFGGRGSILGTLLGALIVGVFQSGLKIAGVDVLWQELALGVLIIAAVAVDQRIRKVKS